MKVAIVGGREFDDYNLIEKTLHEYFDDVSKISLIISGGARGADSLAEEFAKNHQLPLKVYYADWKAYGKYAGFTRNTKIVREADIVFAFWDGRSKGTANTIDQCKTYNVNHEVIRYE